MNDDRPQATHGTGYDDDLVHRFTYHPPADPLLPETYKLIRDAGLFGALLVESTTPPSREASLALTHIEQAVMWANAAVARRGLAGAAGLGADRLADNVWARMAQVCEDRDAPTHLQGTCLRTVDQATTEGTDTDGGVVDPGDDEPDGPVVFHEGQVGTDALAPLIVQLDTDGRLHVRNVQVLGGRGVMVLPEGMDWETMAESLNWTTPVPTGLLGDDPWATTPLPEQLRRVRKIGQQIVDTLNKALAGLPGEG